MAQRFGSKSGSVGAAFVAAVCAITLSACDTGARGVSVGVEPDPGADPDDVPPSPEDTCVPGDASDVVFRTESQLEPVLKPALWTAGTADDWGIPNDDSVWGEVLESAGEGDRVTFAIDYTADFDAGEGPLFYEFQASAVATLDRVVRFAWRYDGYRAWTGPPMGLRVFADGPNGRTVVNVFEGVTTDWPDLDGTVSLTLHEGYTFGITVFDVSVSTLQTNFTLTTLETRAFDEEPAPANPNAFTICPSTAPNQAPILVLGPSFHFDTDPGPYHGLRWAELAPGPPVESAQALRVELAVVDVTGTLAFDEAPTMDAATGDLRFATTHGTYGMATVEITLRDDGGTEDGGIDTATDTFTIRVNSPPSEVNDINIKHEWKPSMVPFVPLANDADELDFLWVDYVTYPSHGFFLWQYMRPEMTAGGNEYYRYSAPGLWRPISCTFLGVDSFTFRVHDNHGGVTDVKSVTIEVLETGGGGTGCGGSR